MGVGSPIIALAAVGAAVGVGMLGVFRWTSNPEAIRRAKARIMAHLYEMRLFPDEPLFIWKAQAGLLATNVRYLGLMLLPATTTTILIFAAVTGLLWLSTVPPTSGLVALMFGTRWLTMLFGFAFFSHQVGGFLGVWLGGWAFEATGSYDVIWWLSVFFGVASAVINLPIVEKPVVRPATAAA